METGVYVPRTFAEKATDPIAFGGYMIIGFMIMVIALSVMAILKRLEGDKKKPKKRDEVTVRTKEHGEETMTEHLKRIGKK